MIHAKLRSFRLILKRLIRQVDVLYHHPSYRLRCLQEYLLTVPLERSIDVNQSMLKLMLALGALPDVWSGRRKLLSEKTHSRSTQLTLQE
jgi:hypothetical protein